MTFRRILLSLFAVLSACAVWSQESQTTFEFLRLPVSAHVSSLGGDAVSLHESDATLLFHNPALADSLSHNLLGLNYMTYMEGTRTASASYVHRAGRQGTWALSGRYLDYGTLHRTDATGERLGDFSARDMAIAATYSHPLAPGLQGGITARMAASYIDDYSSVAALVDLGLAWHDDESGWSVGAVARNLGGQLSAFNDDFERMPLDVQLGATKRLLNSPLRFTATLVRLNDWDHALGRHIVVGADILLGEQFYVAAGYNALRAHEMQMATDDDEGTSAHSAGLSIGAGMTLHRVQLHLSWAKYHVSTSSLLINFSLAL